MLLPLLTDDFPLSLTIGADDAAFCEGFVTVTFTSGTAGVSEGVKSGSFVGFSEGDGVTSGESVAAGVAVGFSKGVAVGAVVAAGGVAVGAVVAVGGVDVAVPGSPIYIVTPSCEGFTIFIYPSSSNVTSSIHVSRWTPSPSPAKNILIGE